MKAFMSPLRVLSPFRATPTAKANTATPIATAPVSDNFGIVNDDAAERSSHYEDDRRFVRAIQRARGFLEEPAEEAEDTPAKVVFGKGGKVTDKQAEALKRKLEEGEKLRLELGRLADEASWFFGYYAKRIDLEVEKARREAMSSPRSPPSSSSSSLRPPPHPKPPAPAALEGVAFVDADEGASDYLQGRPALSPHAEGGGADGGEWQVQVVKSPGSPKETILQSRLDDAEGLIRKLSDELAAANNAMSPTPAPPPTITATAVTPEAISGDDDAFGCFEGAFPSSSDLDEDQIVVVSAGAPLDEVPVEEGGDGLKKALEAAQAQVASLKNEVEESDARVRGLEGEIGRVDSVWMMAVEQLQGQVSSLEMQLGEAEREAEASHIQVKTLEQALAQRGVASHVEGVQSPMSQEQAQGTGVVLRLTSSVLGEALTSASSGSENEKNWSPVTVIHADGSGSGSPDRVRGRYFGSLESDSPAPDSRVVNLEGEVRRLEEERDAERARVSESQAQVETLRARLSEFDGKEDGNGGDGGGAGGAGGDARVSELEAEVRRLEAERDAQRLEIEEMRARLREREEGARLERERGEGELREREARLGEAQDLVADMERRLEESEARLAEMGGELERAGALLLQVDQGAFRARIGELEEEVMRLKNEQGGEGSKRPADEEAMRLERGKVELYQNEVLRLRARILELEGALVRAESPPSKPQRQQQPQQQQQQQHEPQQRSPSKSPPPRGGSGSRISDVQDEVLSLRARISHLEGCVEAVEGHGEEYRARIGVMEEERAALQERVEGLEGELAVTGRRLADAEVDVERRGVEVGGLKSRLAEAEGVNGRLIERVAEFESKEREERGALERVGEVEVGLRARIGEMEREMEGGEEERLVLRGRVRDLDKELEGMMGRERELQGAIEVAREEAWTRLGKDEKQEKLLASLKKRVSDLGVENAQLGARCEEMARSEGRFRDRNGVLEREEGKLSARVEELERAQGALTGRNSELEASLAPLRARVGELEAANRLVEDRARELRFEVEARDETARKAADSTAELKGRIAELEVYRAKAEEEVVLRKTLEGRAEAAEGEAKVLKGRVADLEDAVGNAVAREEASHAQLAVAIRGQDEAHRDAAQANEKLQDAEERLRTLFAASPNKGAGSRAREAELEETVRGLTEELQLLCRAVSASGATPGGLSRVRGELQVLEAALSAWEMSDNAVSHLIREIGGGGGNTKTALLKLQ